MAINLPLDVSESGTPSRRWRPAGGPAPRRPGGRSPIGRSPIGGQPSHMLPHMATSSAGDSAWLAAVALPVAAAALPVAAVAVAAAVAVKMACDIPTCCNCVISRCD